jgi:hypothetical protein
MGDGGFPIKPVRSDFGPEPVNRTPVRSAEKDLDAETTGRLLFHQLAGVGQVSPLAILIIEADGDLSYRWECWNRERSSTGSYAPPEIDVSTPGEVVITYPATVPDRKGDLQPLVFRGGTGNVQSSTKAYFQPAVLPTDPLTSGVIVYTKYFDDAANNIVAALDAPLVVVLW